MPEIIVVTSGVIRVDGGDKDDAVPRDRRIVMAINVDGK